MQPAQPSQWYTPKQVSFNLNRRMEDGSFRCICGELRSAQAAWALAGNLLLDPEETLVQDDTGDCYDLCGRRIPDPEWDDAPRAWQDDPRVCEAVGELVGVIRERAVLVA